MSFEYSFQHLLELKEQEKQSAEKRHQRSVESFEKYATQLYELLKTKEMIERSYQNKMKQGMSVHELQANESRLEFLHQEVKHIQNCTDQARDDMYKQEQKVQSAAIELKQFEKMKEWKQAEYEQWLKKEEDKFLDEISVMMYATR